MSDFYGCLESTSFRVMDRAAFLADPEVALLKAHAVSEEGFFVEDDGYFSFGWYGQYPSIELPIFDDDLPDGVRYVDIGEAIRVHILPGDVCQIGVSGNEKLRYIGGYIWWVTSNGVVAINGQTCWEDRLTENGIRGVAERLAKQVDDLCLRTNDQAAPA
jgi:hypothetical protein